MGESSGVSLALLSFPQPFYMCNYIPPLIENRALPQSSLNKELLFPFCVYLCVCVATTTSYPWVFPLILSSWLIPYRKLITDWLGSCFPLISHGPAWGSVWEIDEDRTKNSKHVVQLHTRVALMARVWSCRCLAVGICMSWPFYEWSQYLYL